MEAINKELKKLGFVDGFLKDQLLESFFVVKMFIQNYNKSSEPLKNLVENGKKQT
jgi:hypothetical protein